MIDPELEVAIPGFDGELPDEVLLFAFGDLFEEDADDAVGGLVRGIWPFFWPA